MDYRNRIIKRMRTLPTKAALRLYADNYFQAGLDALDPDTPSYVENEQVQHIIFCGLMVTLRITEDYHT